MAQQEQHPLQPGREDAGDGAQRESLAQGTFEEGIEAALLEIELLYNNRFVYA